MRLIIPAVILVTPLAAFSKDETGTPSGGLAFREEPGRLVLSKNGQQLGAFVFRDTEILRPYLANLRAPDGMPLTRTHPPVPGVDATDHDMMHPGIWLGFGDISGHDFWRNKGRIVHRKFISPPAIKDRALHFTTESDLVTAEGETLAQMMNAITLKPQRDAWRLTWGATFVPVIDGFYFGDQEEMGLGVRVPTPITEKNGGRIASSEGHTTAKGTWGKPAAWCHYSGVIAGKHVGVLVMPDPKNPHPSWWHNRDYGVFVSNPFGRKAMKQGKKSRIEVKRGEIYRLRHTIVLHSSVRAREPASLKLEEPTSQTSPTGE